MMGVYINNHRIVKNMKTPISIGDVINLSVNRLYLTRKVWKQYKHLSFILKKTFLVDDCAVSSSNANNQEFQIIDLCGDSDDEEEGHTSSNSVENNTNGIGNNTNGDFGVKDENEIDDDVYDQPLSERAKKNKKEMKDNKNDKPVVEALSIMVEKSNESTQNKSTTSPNSTKPPSIASTSKKQAKSVQPKLNITQTQLNDALNDAFIRNSQSKHLKRNLNFSEIEIPVASKIPKFRFLLSPRDDDRYVDDIHEKFISTVIDFDIESLLKQKPCRDRRRVRTQYYDDFEEYER